MGIIGRVVLALIVAIVVGLLLGLLGLILATLAVPIAVTIGGWLVTWSWVLGVAAGLWYFFAGYQQISWPRGGPPA